jgi:hypothetical protein
LLLRQATGQRLALAIAFALQLGAARSFMWVPFETNLVAAFVLWAFVAAKHERWHAAAAACALAALMRPDALLVAVVLGGACSWQLRGRALGPIAVFVLLLAPWMLFAAFYYGSPLPQSAVTKFHRAARRGWPSAGCAACSAR